MILKDNKPMLPPPAVVSSPVASQHSIPSVASIAPPSFNENLVSKNTILNLSKLTIPIIPAETKYKMILRCPQIRKTAIELPFNDALDSYFDLSRYIITQLNLEPHLKAIPFNKKGQPYFYNLDLMHMKLPKLDFSE